MVVMRDHERMPWTTPPPDDPDWERLVAQMGEPDRRPDGRLTVTGAVAVLGGIASRVDLLRLVTVHDLRMALAAGRVVRLGWGQYALPGVAAHRHLAATHHAAVSHLSAALAHRWPVLRQPTTASLTMLRGRRLAGFDRVTITPHTGRLTTDELAAGVTSPLRTVVDCARTLPWGEALAVADSALRSGSVGRGELASAARVARGPGSARIRRVAAAADGAAYGPFESLVRSIALDVDGFTPVPQLEVEVPGLLAHVDIGDPRLKIAIEAESLEFHWKRDELERDCARYTALAAYGWLVLRVTWVKAMHDPGWVRGVIEAAVATRTQ